MRYKVDKRQPTPIYMQLYLQLRGDIVSGAYGYAAKLPSKRLLAEETGVSVVTAEHAYALLCEEGYIENRERSGFYVSYRERAGAGEGPAAGREGLRAAAFPEPRELDEAARPDLEANDISTHMPYPVLARTMRRVLAGIGEELLVKSPGSGVAALKGALADYLARSRGMRVDQSQIVIGSGAEYLYHLVVQVLGREAPYALEDPSYEKIRRMYEANGVRCELLPLGPDGIRSEALRHTAARVLHVTPFHSYPSGITASASKRREYINWARARGGMLVEDDFDSEFTVSTKAEDTLFSMEPEQCVIYMNTFSRTIAPSLRVGYMVLPAGLVGRFQEAVGFYSSTVPAFEQYVLAELLASGDFERHINRVRRAKRRAGGAEVARGAESW